MKAAACARKWQVEAIRDGRLSGKDLDSALRHRAQCAVCAQEERALSSLGEQLAQLPRHAPEELAWRRGRQALLSSWNDVLLHSPEPVSRRRIGVVLTGCAVAAVTAFCVTQWAWPHAHPPPLVEVTARPGTDWKEQRSSEEERIELRDGFASFTVRRHDSHRLFVAVPDGEIEDLGTVFEVEVHDSRTTRVAVEEGRVSVRLQGQPFFELGPGEAWQRAPSRGDDQAATQQRAIASPKAGPAFASSARARPVGSVPKKATDVASAPTATATPNATRADTAEDDAYLHIVDLMRNGRAREARAQASQYLVRFPNGFRRSEVTSIAARKLGVAR